LSKKIFKASEVREIGSKVIITPPRIYEENPEEAEPIERVEEVQPEEDIQVEELEATVEGTVEKQKDRILKEAEKIREEAELFAKKTKEEAEKAAFKLLQKNNIEIRKLKEATEKDAQKIVEDAKKRALEMEKDANQKVEILIQESRKKAYNDGREDGFKKGEEEVKRLIERLHVTLNTAIDKRKEIINSSEKQLLDLVLLVVRKVVKVVSEAEKKVVIENVREALKKIKGETEVTIRVNIKDMDITTKHKKSLISSIEGLENISIEEDSRIAPGGCIIETSFGDVDARIQTQLQIIEDKIRELMPIKG